MIHRENIESKKAFLTFLSIILTVCFALAFFAALFSSCGVWFETNDDVCISEILSGKMTGTPDYHIPYISGCLSFPMSLLYSLFPQVPWWGAFLCGLLVMALTVTLFSLLNNCTDIMHLFLVLIIFGFSVLLGLHNFGQVQFTSAAMLVAVAGYIALCGLKGRVSAYVLFTICELLACMTRDVSMMIVQPIGFAFFCGWTWFDGSDTGLMERIRGKLKEVLTCFGIVVAVIVFSKITTKVMFLSDEWKTFEKTDEVSICLLDYEDKIPYVSLQDILEKYNISEDDYEQFLNYRIDYSDYRFSPECIEELLPRVRQIRQGGEKSGYFNFFAGFWGLLFASKEFFQIHRIVSALFVLLSLLFLFDRKYSLLYVLLLTFGGYVSGLAVITMRNRYVFRVLIPYYSGTILILLVIFATFLLSEKNRNNEKRNVKRIVSIGLVLLFWAWAGYKEGRTQYSYIMARNRVVNSVYKSTMEEISEYCNNNKEKAFILDNSITRFISTPALETQYYEPCNYFYSGSWFGFAPVVIEAGEKYLQGKECYYLVYEAQSWLGADGLDYYDKGNEGEHALFDKFKLSSGATIWVYRINSNDSE